MSALESLRSVEIDGEGLLLRFPRPVRVLSSAVVGGGLTRMASFLNMRVEANFDTGAVREFPPPEASIGRECERRAASLPVTGMMTAASMRSYRHAARRCGSFGIEAHVTAGLSNARRCGDPADVVDLAQGPGSPGTINIMIGTDARLSDAALAEALLLTAETKCAVLLEFGRPSPVSGRPATGTGTDAAGVLCGEGPEIAFCGKHTLFGQLLAETVEEALWSSLEWYRKKDRPT